MSLLDETTSSEMDLPKRGSGVLDLHRESRRVRAMFAGHVIADSEDVLILRRPDLPDMRFFPSEDVEIGYLGETRQITSDPDLGQGFCFTWVMDGEIVERAAYAFVDPPGPAEAVAGRICLSADVFEIYELSPRDLAAAPRATHVHGGPP